MSREVLLYAIGEEGVTLMSKAFGGSDYRVPSGKNSEAFERLEALLGEHRACSLVNVAGGDVLYVPRLHAESLKERNEAILQLLREGLTPGEIARQFTYAVGVSERHVYRIMDRLLPKRSRDGQLDLFVTDKRQDGKGRS